MNLKNQTLTAKQAAEIRNWAPFHYRFGTWQHCFYCGIEPTDQDHVIPWSMISCSENKGAQSHGVKTPACSTCNGLVSNSFFDTLHDRCEFINKRLRRKFSKFLHMESWQSWELKSLDQGLKAYVIDKQNERQQAVKRVGWQFTKEFVNLFDQAHKEAVQQFPDNPQFQNFMKPKWT